MTCLNTLGSPWRTGTGIGLTSGRGFSRPARLYARRLFALTVLVYSANSFSSGTGMSDTEPRWSCEFLPFSAGRGWLREPWPLTLATHNVLPSGVSSTAPGYQPVGIRPRTALASGASLSSPTHFLPRRTTATQLLVPLAAYSVLPSGLRARAFVPLPNGSRPSGRHEMVS